MTASPGIARSATLAKLRSLEGTPLTEVIRQINRYRSSDIILANKEAGTKKVVASLVVADIDDSVDHLQQLLNLQVQRLPGGVIVIS